MDEPQLRQGFIYGRRGAQDSRKEAAMRSISQSTSQSQLLTVKPLTMQMSVL